MNKTSIENTAHQLRKEIWLAYHPTRHADTPLSLAELVGLLAPENAASILGISFEYLEQISTAVPRNVGFETAGLLDRQSRRIAISKKFGPEVGRFTGAHEIGHWLLHKHHVVHRDRPIKGLTKESHRRELIEQEADYFAACYLMPRKLVLQALEHTFHVKTPFEFNHETSFWLRPSDYESLMWPETPLERALALATAETYKGRQIIPLAKQFHVTSTSMAIRIQELGLIAE